jgi:hypothetical protein
MSGNPASGQRPAASVPRDKRAASSTPAERGVALLYQAHALADLAGRAVRAAGAGPGRVHSRRLGLPRRGPGPGLRLAAGLERRPEAAALLAAGVLDRDRARILCDELACVDADLARAAAGRVLPRAGG